MSLIKINSYPELQERLKGKSKAFLLLYKEGAEQSECARDNLEKASTANKDIDVLMANVAQVRDIHGNFNIRTAPSLLVFEDGEFKNVIKGCQDESIVDALFKNAIFTAKDTGDRPRKNVTVYSTPTCTWCNTLKSHLRKHGIHFTDIDISADPTLAEELVRKSGQQGVPQTEIDGEIIVGFDKSRINKLLEIQ
jgi:glutaredoxin-like YruB-family protein